MGADSGLYTQIAAMEPLFPASAGSALAAQLPSAIVRTRVANLVREMNSYYSNLIEGHKTLPRDIERALRGDYSSNPERRASQWLNRAHIETETLMLQRLE